MLPKPFILFSVLLFSLLGCRPNYFLLHPLAPVPEIYRETEFFDRGRLRVHWLARYPDRKGPLPAVLVHPDRGSLAGDMEGICLALARLGYFAAAADYQHLDNMSVRNPLIPWRSREEAVASLQHLKEHPRVDSEKVALLGFSKGSILSLQLASEAPDLKAVVAYYPMTDFAAWGKEGKESVRGRLLKYLLERRMEREEGIDGKELREKYWGYAPIKLVDRIQAPVLVIHGEKDLTFPVEQSRRFCEAMNAAGKKCEALIIPKAGHVFNFINPRQGREAWERTVEFLDRHMKLRTKDGG